jgi:predicted PurR-regulated permease PerM
MNLKLTPGRALALVIAGLSVWIVHPFIEAVLAACVTATASWPVYTRFAARLPSRLRRGQGAAAFTLVLTVFVLAPMAFACWALLGEAHALLLDLANVQGPGVSGALRGLAQHADPALLLGWAQSAGQFTIRQALTVGFTILLLCCLFQEGASLARGLTDALRQAIGDRADRYVDVAASAVRAAVASMLIVGLFDTLATGLAYAIAGAPHALVWAAIAGALAAIPFLGYAAVAAMAVQLALKGATTPAWLSLLLGCAVLLAGDKVVRPLAARGGIRLPFVWVLMGCVGGFAGLGLAGLVIGPVVLSLARELWLTEHALASPAPYDPLREDAREAPREPPARRPSQGGARTGA